MGGEPPLGVDVRLLEPADGPLCGIDVAQNVGLLVSGRVQRVVRLLPLDLVIRYRGQQAVAVILIGHRLTGVFAACDRIMALRQGEVIADGPTARTTMNRVVAHVVGAD